MDNAHRRSPPPVVIFLLLALGALAAACGESDNSRDASVGHAPSGERVCPDCTKQAPGGETSDFGSQLACSLAYVYRDVTAAEAERLGFIVADITRAIERPIDAAMTWQLASDLAAPPSGYEPSTRITGALDVRAYRYGQLDPDACDRTSCRLKDGSVVDTAGCEPFLFVTARGELATADGALAVTFPQQPVKVLSPGDRTEATVAANADMSQATGSLHVEPPFEPPYTGMAVLSLEYVGDTITSGVIDVEYFAGSSTDLMWYQPLQAVWGVQAERPSLDAPDGSADGAVDAAVDF